MEHSACQERLEAYKEEHLPVVLTPAEAMDILGVGKNTLYRMLHSGQLPAIRIGRIWRINLESLQAYLSHPPTLPNGCNDAANRTRQRNRSHHQNHLRPC